MVQMQPEDDSDLRFRGLETHDEVKDAMCHQVFLYSLVCVFKWNTEVMEEYEAQSQDFLISQDASRSAAFWLI
jgi:hypothetical protein